MKEATPLESLQVALADRYRIKGELGSGGMATVYLAEDLRHHRDLAIKVLKPELASLLGPDRFRREIEIAARLSHPNILALIDSGETGGVLYYVMPYVAGESLRSRLKREGQLPIGDALRITEQVAVALDYAHRQGIVHRDIKPENILLHEGQALVADFGIALVLRSADETRLTQTGFGLGTPEYMSPEQATGERESDARSDVYSLACVLYELLVGEPPYSGNTPRAILVKCLSQPVPSARVLRETTPWSVDAALKRALAKAPADRFATTLEFTAALTATDAETMLSESLSVKGAGIGELATSRTPHRTNLPVQATALVGRRRELSEAGALLRSHRLLTLTGPGGSGKTRLALQLATEALDEFPEGVYWVPLQALRDPALVEGAIVASLGADTPLAEHVANKRLLILLDNFEQVIDAAATVSSLLLRTASSHIIVTSREPLHVDGERRYPVEPLPDEDASALFVERAQAVAPEFRPTPVVADICRRLDGLPLAIELAAARVALLDPDELLARLERRLPLLASHSRNAPARQRTLRAAIEWSYELLPPEEQNLFRRLAVFAGSFSLEAAAAVCDADIDTLESLVVKSLLRRWDGGRLGMLETIREYALEKLDASPEAMHVHRRHAEYFLRVAVSANLNSGKVAVGGWRFEIAQAEQDNIRAALAWALDANELQLAVDIAVAMESFWVNDDPREGMRWFSAVFDRPGIADVRPESRAHALRSYGSSAAIAGDDETAERLCKQSLALFEELGDEHGRAELLHRLGIQTMRRRDLARARTIVQQSHDLFARHENDFVRTYGHMQTTGTLGAIARDSDDATAARQLITRSAELARSLDMDWWEGGMFAELAMVSLHANNIAEAEPHAFKSLTLAEKIRDRPGRVFGVGLFATIAAERGEAEIAGRLWGAIEDYDVGAPLGGWRRHREVCRASVEKVTGPDFERGRAEGRALTLEEAVSVALASAAARGADGDPTPRSVVR